MNCKEIFEKLCEYAPLKLSDDIVQLENGYDNSGVISGNIGEIENALVCLDLTKDSVDAALRNGCNLIVTHHPAIYKPIKNINENSPLAICMRNNVAVISMHLNLDCAEFGIDYYFARGLGGKNIRILEKLGDNVGYGRCFDLDEKTPEQIINDYKNIFDTDKVAFYGDKDKIIRSVASFCGAGLGENEIKAALSCGVDMVASADIPHHILLSAIESGLTVLSCTHYATENYGMKKFAEYADKTFKNLKILFFDDKRFL